MKETVIVKKIEVVQAIQNESHDVKLIKGKKTYARVYIDEIKSRNEGEYRVDGELHCVQKNGNKFIVNKKVSSLESISVRTNEKRDWQKDRLDWRKSLNFDITNQIGKVDYDLKLEFTSLKLISLDQKKPDNIQLNGDPRLVIDKDKLRGSPGLCITALVIGFWDSYLGEYVEPAPASVELIRHFVSAALPLDEGSIKWNVINVRASGRFRALAKTSKFREDLDEVVSRELRELLLQTVLHRNQDLYFKVNTQGGAQVNDDRRDIRTLYLGVFDDPSGRLGGAAADSPDFVAHNIVGVAVADPSGQTGCHELAHMLGRKHPGVPLKRIYGPQIGQSQEDDCHPEISEQGFLSNAADNKSIGLHCDPRSSTPRVFEHNYWHDLMTYRDPQWVSNYTYEGLRKRLGLLFVNFTKDKFESKHPNQWLIIGEYDLGRKTGSILYALPTTYETGEPKDKDGNETTSEIKMECHYAGKDKPVIRYVAHRTEAVKDMPTFGIFQVTVDGRGLNEVELKVLEIPVDKYSALGGQNDMILKYLKGEYNKTMADPDKPELRLKIENGRQYIRESGKPMVFFYSVKRDAYLLRFNWRRTIKKATGQQGSQNQGSTDLQINTQIVTTIKCKKPSEDCWETVLVTTRQRGVAWVSPNFVERPGLDEEENGKDLTEPPYSFVEKRSRKIADRKEDKLTYKVIVTSGFTEFELNEQIDQRPKIQFPRSSFQNMKERTAHIDALEEESRNKEARIYKRRVNQAGSFRPLRDKHQKSDCP